MPEPTALTVIQPATRRHALVAGLLAAAGLSTAPVTTARKRKKNSCKKKISRKVEETCGRQRGPCLDEGRKFCATTRDPAACEATVGACCEFMAQCEAQEYIDCMAAAFGNPDPV